MDTEALRKKILDLAIRGKLVPQDPNDESASVLLEKIRAEKQKLVKEGKLKPKDIRNDTIIFKGEDNLHYEKFQDGTVKCIEDEIPFDVPEGWEWVRLGFLAHYKKGPFGSSITKSMFVPDSENAIKVYEQKNAINKDDTLGTYFITKEKYEELKSFELFPNEIIVSCAGTIGESYVMPQNMRKGIINQALMKISLFDMSLLEYYLLYFDFKLKESANAHGYGVALKNIPPFDVLKQYLVAIPPVKEQKRIIFEVNRTENIINLIENNSKEISDLISLAKSKILDLAIRGKLVPQDPNDEPASVLLERIRAEKEELIKQGKIKRNKKESVIFKGDDNSYYDDIPESWSKCYLSEISYFERGITFPASAKEFVATDDNIACARTTNVQEYFNINDLIYINKLYLKNNKSKLLRINDIIISTANSLELVGKSCIVNELSKEMSFGGFVTVIRSILIKSKYLHLCLKNLFYKGMFSYKSTQTTNIANITSFELSMLEINLPPLAEQQRIIETTENIFSMLDTIVDNIS